MNPTRSTWQMISVLLVAIALAVTACGGDDSTDEGSDGDAGSTETTAASSDSADASDSADSSDTTVAAADSGGGETETPAVTEMGSFTVNGTEFAVTFLNRCIPFDGPDSEQIDLQPIAQGQGAQLNLYGTADSVEVSVQGSAVEQIGGTNSFAADPFGDDGEIKASSIDGDRWTGEATLADSYGSTSTVDLTWDVMIPEEIRDCSL